jgi:ethanolamine ammonia-lyase small subunit
LQLRQDHAAALDAVQAELDLQQAFDVEFVSRWNLFEVLTQAANKEDFLRRPDRGRRLSEDAKINIKAFCPSATDLQVIIGDGLSAIAVALQVPRLLPLLQQEALQRGWTFGRPFVLRYCRVGILNDVGALLDPAVAVLLIGERPGLATAESLSAYMAYRPRPGHTDAQRNLISNIHTRGLDPQTAVRRIVNLAAQMRRVQSSGVAVKEELVAHDALLQRSLTSPAIQTSPG